MDMETYLELELEIVKALWDKNERRFIEIYNSIDDIEIRKQLMQLSLKLLIG